MEPTTNEKTGAAVSSFGERHSSLARAVEVLRVEGVRSFWFKALGQTIYRRVVVMECPFADAIRSVSAHVSVVVGLSEDVGEYVTFRPRTDPADFHRRLRSGHRCFVARHEGRIVHACWAATGRIWIEYLGRHLVLPPDSVYHYDSFTIPEFRGLNISAFRVTEAARYFRAAGYRRLVAVVAPENLAAFRPLEKAGYRRVGRMGYVRIGPWRYQFSRRTRSPHSPSPDYWDDIAAETRRRAPLDPWRAYMQRVYERLVEKWLPSSSSPGMKTDLFEEAITSYHVLPALGSGSIGLDCSSATVAAARARLSATGGRYLFLVADLRALPMRAGVVGRILAGSSLDHFADKAELATSLAELTRVLRPGGALLVTLDNPHNPVVWLRNHLPFALLNRVGLVPYYVGQTYGLAEAKAQLGSLGLTVGPVAAVAHVPRAPAIWLVALGECLNAAGLLRRLGGLLDAFERLERWPTRYRTGYYLAIKAEKPFSTGRTS
jgi:SAM-dependent methyltransferase/ribosomal protein S18 acetylase RimI-like enzyme